jgi:hypothetical protein
LWYQQQISFHYRIVVTILSSDEPLANQFRWRFYVQRISSLMNLRH